MAQNDSEWPILPDSQLFQSFSTEVAQNDLEQPVLPNPQLFQSFFAEVAQNDSQWPISPDSQFFQSFPTEVPQNDLEWPISPDSQLFHLFPPKWPRMTWNGQFSMAKIKYTLIQGNFYERSPFYMDSCALSPMASLLTSAGILGQHDILVLADDPSTSGKLDFIQVATFPIFSHQSGSEWLGMANFAWFTTFPIFSHQSGSEWLGMAYSPWPK